MTMLEQLQKEAVERARPAIEREVLGSVEKEIAEKTRKQLETNERDSVKRVSVSLLATEESSRERYSLELDRADTLEEVRRLETGINRAMAG